MSNVYIIVGNSFHLINDEIKKIVKLNDNIIHLNYQDGGLKRVLEEASYFSLDNTKKIIIVENFVINDDAELLKEYLINPNEASIIILVTDNIDSRKKIVKDIKENNGLIVLPKIDYRNVYDMINNYLKQTGYTIEYKASNYLVSQYGLNIDIIFNELDKLKLFYNKPCLIKYDDTINVASSVMDDNSFHFIDACIKKDGNNALRIYHDLKIYKVEEISLIIILAREYRLIYLIKKMTQKHQSINEIMGNLKMMDWQVKKLYDESLNYSEKELTNIILGLARFDNDLKKGILSKDVAIQNFILEFVV